MQVLRIGSKYETLRNLFVNKMRNKGIRPERMRKVIEEILIAQDTFRSVVVEPAPAEPNAAVLGSLIRSSFGVPNWQKRRTASRRFVGRSARARRPRGVPSGPTPPNRTRLPWRSRLRDCPWEGSRGRFRQRSKSAEPRGLRKCKPSRAGRTDQADRG